MASSPTPGRRLSLDSPLMGLFLGLAAASLVWFLAILFPRFFLNLELHAERLMLQRRGIESLEAQEPRVVLVARDDASYDWVAKELDQPPGEWSRKIYADLLRRLRGLGAKAVAFDLVFDSEKTGSEDFQAALAEKPDTVLAVNWQEQVTQAGEARGRTHQIQRPLKILSEVSRQGAIRVPVDQDELVRRYFLDVRLRDDMTMSTLAPELVKLGYPEFEFSEADLDLDDQRGFALDFRSPSPAFEEVEIYRLLDPERFFELSWRRILSPDQLAEGPISIPRVEAGTRTLRILVNPPDLQVEALAMPLAEGRWSRAEGKGEILLEGLSQGPYALHVARSLGKGSWGIFSRPRIRATTTPVEIDFPATVAPLEVRISGKLPEGAAVLLTGQGMPLGLGNYRERLTAQPGEGGVFRTPSAAEENFYLSVGDSEPGVVSRGAPVPTFPAPSAVTPRQGMKISLASGTPPCRGLVVSTHLPLPPFRAEIPNNSGVFEFPSPGEDFTLLTELEDGGRLAAAQKRPNIFQDALVLVGPTAGLDQDFVLTPWDHHSTLFEGQLKTHRLRTPGVEIHAHAVRTLLGSRALRTPSGVERMGLPSLFGRFWSQLPLLGLMLLLSGLLGMLLKRSISRGSWLILILGLLAYQQLAFYLFYRYRIWIHVVTPMLGVGFTWVTILWFGYATVERRRKEIRAAFQHYLDPDIVRELELNPGALALGGKQQQVTCFFSDIEGFSSFSEVMTPPELVAFINEYLTAMSDLLLKYGAWIDKFIGDAIVAVFNAPRDQPDHAFRCVLVALEMKQREAELRAEWSRRGLPQVKTRIGINTGSAIVGNVGTLLKKDYTILGDAVNLAARLEALNKSYGTYLMVGENTYREIKGRFDSRELDLVRVKGKKVPAAVYQVVALRGESGSGFLEAREIWERALQSYRTQDFDLAEKSFREVLALLPEDGPSLMYPKRLETLRKLPPPEDWDGVWTMEHK